MAKKANEPHWAAAPILEMLRGILRVCRTDHVREHGLGFEATRDLASIVEDFIEVIEKD